MHETYRSTSSDGSHYSYETSDSRSTAPTSVHSSVHYPADRLNYFTKPNYDISPDPVYGARSSAETYASTIAGDAGFVEEPESYDVDEVPQYRFDSSKSDDVGPRPSSPSNFAELFPSSRRMFIRHDDSSYDGNMNLRVETEDASNSDKGNVQLFHLRMKDLKRREFSLRRYERSSGREVCNSKRKLVTTHERNILTRSVSNAFTSIVAARPEFRRTKSGLSTHSTHSTGSTKTMNRQDSGYGSSNEGEDDDDEIESSTPKGFQTQESPDTMKLEFSNYAQVEVKRKGSRSRRYDFEYWGHAYSWKRIIEKDGAGEAVSYHLSRDDSLSAVAHIVPEMLSPSQIREERSAGGWIPPCSMWISDQSVWDANSDVPDVIVATGLIALVDDCVKRCFKSKSKSKRQVSLPLTQVKMDMEFVGPRAIVEHVFQRRDSSGSTKEKEHRGSPLRFTTPVSVY